MRILRLILPFIALILASGQVAFAACTPITLAPGDVTPGAVGTPYNLTFAASGSAATPFAYEVTSGVLPAGLNLDAVTGALTGTPTAAGSFPITVSATDTAGCSGGRAYVLSTGQGSQTISFTSIAPAAATVGGPTYNVTATATSGLPVAFTIDASATSVCSITGSTVSFTAIGTCVIDANQAGNASYTAAPQVQQSFGVAQGSQTITFTSTPPPAASVGGPTYTVTATATSGLPVTFTIDATATSVCSISGSTVSFLAAGNCVIDANQAGDANYSAAPQVQQTFGVGKSAQTITFTSTAPAAATVGGATYNVTATASSGLTVTFTIDAAASTVCSISGSTVSFIGAGSCVIDANQAGDINFNPAPQVQQTFAVAKGSQTITYTSTAPAAATVGGATYTVTATATSGLAVAFTIDASATTICSIAGSTVSFIGAGTCVIDANQAGNSNYNAAPQVQQSFAVGKGAQTISFTSTAPAGASVGGPTYTVTATATSGLAVTLTIDASAATVCSIAGSTVSFIGVGTCVIDANQAGNANYNAAPQVQQSFAVGQGAQTITFTSTAPAAATVGGPTYTVTATATSGLTVTFTIDATAASVCSIAGSTVSFIGAGTCVIDANQAGNANYAAAPQVQQSFGVNKNNQTISFTSTAPAGAVVAGPTYTVTATATSALPVTFTIDATATSVCSIAGSTVSFIGVGTCVIDANQAGNGSFNPAPQVQQSFAVGKGSQTISFTSVAPVGAAVGGPTYTVTATATSGLPVTFTIDASASTVCTIAGSTVSFIGAGTCVIDANQPGNANYNAAPQAQQSFAVAKGNQTISFTSTAPVAAQFNGPTYTVTATATSGLAVTFTIDATATSVCSIAGSTVSFIGVGTCVIDANQAGDANYNAAPQAQQSFAVGKASQTISFTSTPPSPALVTGTYTVTATATSGLGVTFTIDATASAVCSIAGSLVTFNAGGTCVIDANQAGNANYSAAPQVQQSFLVTKNNQTITFTSTAPATAKNGGPTYTVSATATSGLTVTFTIDATATGVCSVAGSVVSFIGAGTCVIDANQAGNGAYNAAPQVQQSFLVAKGDQTISFTSVLAAFRATGTTYTATATATSGLPVTFTIDAASTSGCTIAGATVTFTAPVGTCIIDANQAGNVNWNPAPQVQQSTTVEIPVSAGADSHTVTGNVSISVPANGVLANDTGNPIAISSYGVNGNEVAPGTATPTAQGGSVTLNANGSYSFTPKPNFNGTDTFKYIIANDVSSSTGTVSLVVADRIMVVTTGGGGSCIPASPCTLASADAAISVSPSTDLVYVEGGTYNTATFSMTNNQKLVGGAVDLNTAITDAAITLAPDSVAPANIGVTARPTFNNNANVITLAGNNLVEYFNINPTGGSAIFGNTVAATTNSLHDIAITGTAAANGVNLTTNTGATFNFSNLVITTAAGNAFSATGGGTVNATTGATPNTLATTTGTALNVVNTTIGVSGLNFQSIFAGTAASGPASGIVLNNTGGGGLAVTGTGAAGSGGTIQKTTGNAIDMTSTGAVNLSWMTIQNSTHLGINGTTLGGFTLGNSSVINNGTIANVDDGIRLLDVSGAATFTSDTVTGNHVTNLFFGGTVASTTVTNSLTVANGTYGNSATNSGIQVGMTHTSTLKTATFTNVTFSGNASTGLQVQSNDNSIVGDGVGAPATGTVTVSGCTFTNNAGNTAIDIDQGGGNGAGQMYARLMNNVTITGNGGPAINVFTSSSATGGTMKVRIDGNHVGNAGVIGSGTTLGPGIRVFLQGKTTNTVTIVNNIVRQTLGSRAIDVEAIGPVTTGQPLTVSDIVITGNNADTNDETNPSGSLDAIYVAADNQGSPAQVNAEIHGNTIPAFTGANGCFDYPTFDGNAPWLYYRIATAGAVAKLFNFGGHANANTEISTTQTAGIAGADIANFGGVQLTAVPVNSIP